MGEHGEDEGTATGRGGLNVVLGARGGTGGAIVRELVGQGRRVRAVTRNGDAGISETRLPPASYEDWACDLTDREQLRRAVAGASVVYHCARPKYTRWWREFRPLNEGIVEAVAEAGARLVYADSLAMYEPGSSPMSEQTPATATTKKGALRAELAAELLAEHESGRLRVVIGRSSDYFGPGGLNSALGGRFFATLLGGKKTQWFMDLDQPHSVSYLPDLARAFVILGTRPEAEGGVWHTPATVVTGREFIQMAAEAAGVTPQPAVLRERTVTFYGLFVPTLGEYPELAYQWAEPFVSDASRFEAAFGPFTLTPLDEALRETVAWYRSCPVLARQIQT
jgi:nucleoside-diphosphate-sugar epimerase